MPETPSETSSLAGKFLQHIASLHPDRPMVSISDVKAPSAAAMKALDFLCKNSFVAGRSYRSTGNDEGVVAISEVRLTRRGRDWLAMLKGPST
jgi:hypothetical protein